MWEREAGVDGLDHGGHCIVAFKCQRVKGKRVVSIVALKLMHVCAYRPPAESPLSTILAGSTPSLAALSSTQRYAYTHSASVVPGGAPGEKISVSGVDPPFQNPPVLNQ